jgi:4-hydroxybenzoate polyprenyltransferase
MNAATLVGLVRPFTLLAPVVGTASGAAVAAAALSRPWATPALLAASVSAAAATGASNAWNQVFDVELDRVNKPERPLPSGRISAQSALLLGHGLALLALLVGALASWPFVACVAFGLLATWVYSAPPARTKARPFLALLTIAVPRGVLVPVAGWSVVAEPTRTDPWALGLVSGLFVLGAAGTKDFSDVAGDRAHGCRTLPVLLGPERAARWMAPFLALPFLLYPALGALGWLSADRLRLLVLGLALAVLGALTARALLRDPARLASGERNHPAWRGMYLLLIGSHVGAALVYLRV